VSIQDGFGKRPRCVGMRACRKSVRLLACERTGACDIHRSKTRPQRGTGGLARLIRDALRSHASIRRSTLAPRKTPSCSQEDVRR